MMNMFIRQSLIAITLCSPVMAMADYPVAIQDNFSAIDGRWEMLEVLANDSGENLNIIASNNWTLKGGRTSISNSFERKKRIIYYRPPDGFSGEDEFWYALEDEQGRTNSTKVTIHVRPAGSPVLLPKDDTVSVQKDTTIRINVMKNDAGPSMRLGDYNEWSEKGGRITKQDNFGERSYLSYLIYTPPKGFVGTDTFWYVIDGGGLSGLEPNAAKVTVVVTEESSAGVFPTGQPDNVTYYESVPENETYYYPLDNDLGNELRLVGSDGYSEHGGRYSLTKSRIKYRPANGFSGKDRVWYVFEDELGRTNFSVITFTVK